VNTVIVIYLVTLGGIALLVCLVLAWLGLLVRRQRKARERDMIRSELRGLRSAMRISVAANQARRQIIEATHDQDDYVPESGAERSEWGSQ
jgi:hypothetical protein